MPIVNIRYHDAARTICASFAAVAAISTPASADLTYSTNTLLTNTNVNANGALTFTNWDLTIGANASVTAVSATGATLTMVGPNSNFTVSGTLALQYINSYLYTGSSLSVDRGPTVVMVGGSYTIRDNLVSSGSVVSNTSAAADGYNPYGTLVFRNASTEQLGVSGTPLQRFLTLNGVTPFTANLVVGPGKDVQCLSTFTLLRPMDINGGSLSVGSLIGASSLRFLNGTYRQTASVLSVGNGGPLGNTLALDSATRRVEALAGLDIGATGSLDLTGSSLLVGGTLTNNGILTTATDQTLLIATTLTNNGAFSGRGRIAAALNNSATGIVRVNAGTALRFTTTDVNSNAGSLLADGGSVEVFGSLSNSGQVSSIAGDFRAAGLVANITGGRINTRNGVLRFDGGLTNFATLGVSFGTGDIYGNLTNQSTGVIAVSGNSTATFYGSLANAGRVSVSTGSQAVFFGSVSGSGTYAGGGTFFYEGAIRPGNSPGLMSITGDADFGGGSSIEIEIAGPARGTSFDAINVSGRATFDGSITVLPLAGYLPLPGDTFRVFEFASSTGTPAAIVSGYAARPGLSFRFDRSADAGTLVATAIAGDANLDGVVGFDDLLTLAQNYGRSGGINWLGADFTRDGGTNFDDLLVLAQNYGRSSMVFAADWALAQSLVPEPASVLVIAASLAAIGSRRRRVPT